MYLATIFPSEKCQFVFVSTIFANDKNWWVHIRSHFQSSFDYLHCREKSVRKRSPRRAQQPATCHPRRNEFSDINTVTHCTLQTLTQLDVGHVCPKNKHELSHMWARSGGTIIAGSRRVIHCRIRQDYIMAQAAERKGRQPRRTNTSSTPQGPQKILYLVPNSKLLRRVLAADFNGIRTGSG